MRWDIEAFYRDFEHILRGTHWHCISPISFQKELLMQMIVLCLIRMAMLDASRAAKSTISQLSFSRALTETRLFFKLLLIQAGVIPCAIVTENLARWRSRYSVNVKPNRQYSRDRQKYREKSRGLHEKRKGRIFKIRFTKPQTPDPEIL
jgi:hypothetical protein